MKTKNEKLLIVFYSSEIMATEKCIQYFVNYCNGSFNTQVQLSTAKVRLVNNHGSGSQSRIYDARSFDGMLYFIHDPIGTHEKVHQFTAL